MKLRFRRHLSLALCLILLCASTSISVWAQETVSAEITFVENFEDTVNVDVALKGSGIQELQLAAAVYQQSLKGVAVQRVTLEEEMSQEVSFHMETGALSGDYTVKVFALENLSSLRPLTEPVTKSCGEEAPDPAVLFDANKTGAAALLGTSLASVSEEQVAQDSRRSVKLDFSSSGSWFGSGRIPFADRGVSTDWRSYGYVNFRIYSVAANNSKMNVIFAKDAASDDSGYLRTQLTFDFTGWKDIQIPLSELEINRDMYSVSSVGAMHFNIGGWNTQVDNSTVLYLDKIWLSDDSADEDTVVFNSNNAKAATMTGMRVQSADESVAYEGSKRSIAFDLSRASWYSTDRIVFAHNSITTDWSGYEYLKIRLYSPEEKSSGLNIVVDKSEDTDDNGYWRREISFDFTGWKTLEIPLSSFEANRGINSWREVGSLYLNAGGWNVTYDNSLKFYIDKIWLGNYEEPEEPDGKDMIFNADRLYAAEIFGTNVQSINTQIVAEGSRRSLKFDLSGKTWFDSSRVVFENQGTTTDWRPYGYLNLRLYNETASDTKMNVILAKAADSNDSGYFLGTVSFDREGWQVIQIPLHALAQSNLNSVSEVRSMTFNIGGWGNTFDRSVNTVFYLDKIWLSDDSENPENVIFNGNDAKAASMTGMRIQSANTEHVYEGSSQSVEFDISKGSSYSSDWIVTKDQGITSDWSTYQSLKLRVYNPASSTGGVNLIASKDASSMDAGYYLAVVSFDFEGWQDIEIPLSSFTPNREISSWSEIGGVCFNVGGWNTPVDTNLKFYVDKIWLE